MQGSDPYVNSIGPIPKQTDHFPQRESKSDPGWYLNGHVILLFWWQQRIPYLPLLLAATVGPVLPDTRRSCWMFIDNNCGNDRLNHLSTSMGFNSLSPESRASQQNSKLNSLTTLAFVQKRISWICATLLGNALGCKWRRAWNRTWIPMTAQQTETWLVEKFHMEL